MRKLKTTILRRLTVALMLLLAAGTVMAIVPDPKKKKRVTITTTTTTTKKTPTRRSGTTSQKPSTPRMPSPTIGTQADRSKPNEYTTINVDGVSFRMIKVEGGTFMMGATSEQGNGGYGYAEPAHLVTLSSYYIGETEVTQELWQAVMGNNPSNFQGSHRPVEKVSWEDCQEFVRRLNQKTGRNFRLPTEAEWEYAARGGRKSNGYKYAGGNNIGGVAWYDGNSNSQTHDVGQKRPNEIGLYDMAGNVWEWCQDWYGDYSSSAQTNPKGPSSGSSRVRRGGSWDGGAGRCCVSYRGGNSPSIWNDYLGLRLAL